MFDYWFVRKLKQCCSGRLGQPFGRVRSASAGLQSFARFQFVSTCVFKLRTFVRSVGHFLLIFWCWTQNCSTWESFDNQRSTMYGLSGRKIFCYCFRIQKVHHLNFVIVHVEQTIGKLRFGEFLNTKLFFWLMKKNSNGNMFNFRCK